MVLLCECEWIFSHFLRFCAGAREYFEKNSLKNRIVGEKNFGESRTGGAAALSRELSEFFGPKLFSSNAESPGKNFPDRTDSQWESVKKFPRPRRTPEKISQTAMRIVRGRLLDPTPSPSPGEMDPRPRIPRPAAVRECKRVGPNCHWAPPIKPQWDLISDTFFVVAGISVFWRWDPASLRVLGPPWGGPMGPLLRRTHGKNFASNGMLNTLFTPPKKSLWSHIEKFLSFSIMPKYSQTYPEITQVKAPKNFTCSPQIFSLLS